MPESPEPAHAGTPGVVDRIPWRRAALLAPLGVLVGYLYHQHVGCLLGGCMDDGPLMDMIHGGLVAIVIGVAIP